jgi:hypothetical protein
MTFFIVAAMKTSNLTIFTQFYRSKCLNEICDICSCLIVRDFLLSQSLISLFCRLIQTNPVPISLPPCPSGLISSVVFYLQAFVPEEHSEPKIVQCMSPFEVMHRTNCWRSVGWSACDATEGRRIGALEPWSLGASVVRANARTATVPAM